jgi:hypothetical protein
MQPAPRNARTASWLRDFGWRMIANGIPGPPSIGGLEDAIILPRVVRIAQAIL